MHGFPVIVPSRTPLLVHRSARFLATFLTPTPSWLRPFCSSLGKFAFFKIESFLCSTFPPPVEPSPLSEISDHSAKALGTLPLPEFEGKDTHFPANVEVYSLASSFSV